MRNLSQAIDDHVMGIHDPNAPFNQDDSFYEAVGERFSDPQWDEIEDWFCTNIRATEVLDHFADKFAERDNHGWPKNVDKDKVARAIWLYFVRIGKPKM